MLQEMVRAKIFVMELPRRVNRRLSFLSGQTAFKSELIHRSARDIFHRKYFNESDVGPGIISVCRSASLLDFGGVTKNIN